MKIASDTPDYFEVLDTNVSNDAEEWIDAVNRLKIQYDVRKYNAVDKKWAEEKLEEGIHAFETLSAFSDLQLADYIYSCAEERYTR